MTTESNQQTKATTGFRKYDKLLRQGHRYTREIETGNVLVFPKLDGTNASVWSDGEEVFCGSRNRQLAEGFDNAGFRTWVMSTDPVAEALRQMALLYPDMIFYGEWLVPNVIKGYNEDAWRKFYIFDVFERSEGFRGYIPYDSYVVMLQSAGQNFIEPIARFENPTGAQLKELTETNTFLMQAEQIGEGVVVKNYEWRNQDVYDRVWGKFVRSEFKAAHGAKSEPRPVVNVEPAVAEEFVTQTLVSKCLGKVLIDVASSNNIDVNDDDWKERAIDDYRGRIIPQLIGRVWNDILEEEMASIVKKFKTPTIDFKELRSQVTRITKTLAPELF